MQNNLFINRLIDEDIDKLEELIDTIPIGIYITTVDGEIILLNNTLINLLHFNSKDDFKRINLNTNDNLPNIVNRQNFIKTLQRTGHLEKIVNQYITNLGNIIFVNENSLAVNDENGKIKYIIGTIEDITDKIKLEKEEKFFLDFMNVVNDALINLVENPYMLSSIEYSFNLIGSFLKISTIQAFFLKKYDKFPEFEDFECVVNWNEENVNTQYNNLFKDILENFPGIIEGLMNGNNFFYNKDKSSEFQRNILLKYNTNSFLCTPIIYGNKFTGVIFFADKIEERDWDDSALKFLSIIGNAIGNHWNNFQNLKKIEELKNTLERIIEASNLGIWEYQIEKDKLEVNYFFRELMSLPLNQSYFTCQSIIDVISEEAKSYLNRSMTDLIDGKAHNLNVDFKINSFPQKYLQMKGKVIEWDANNKPKKISGILLDITELKVLQNQLQETIRIKDKFFDIIAHDLKNPMNAVKSLLDDLLSNFNLFSSEELYEAQSQIQKSISILSQLVNNLLEWSRNQTGRTIFNPDNIDTFYIVNNSIDVNYFQAKLKDINLINMVAQGTIVYADSNMLYTIFRNIISNAIKYTPNKGTVTISAKDLEDFYEFNISDTGIGMNEKQIANLFSLEHIQSLPGTNQEKGTGLGLIISKEFVERNGGQIYVTSKVDEGTTFSFTIPKFQK